MPAPVECRSNVFINQADGLYTYRFLGPVTVLSLRCEACPVIKKSFTPESRFPNNPIKEVIEKAQVFLGQNCGLRTKQGQAVILPPELGRQAELV